MVRNDRQCSYKSEEKIFQLCLNSSGSCGCGRPVTLLVSVLSLCCMSQQGHMKCI